MSHREKTLLKLLVFAALVAGLLFGYKRFYEPRYKKAQRELIQAQQNTEQTKMFLSNADLVVEEQKWLGENEPQPMSQQSAQSDLQAICELKANNAQLEIKRQTPLSSVQKQESFYHRARMEMLITGTEANFYNWLSALDDPSTFRRVTKLRMNPMRDDDTKIEAQAVIEQWFVPETTNNAESL